MKETNREKIERIYLIMCFIVGKDITEKKRTKELTEARFICFKTMFEISKNKSEISNFFNVHHTVVLHGINKFDLYIQSDKEFKKLYNKFVEFYESSLDVNSLVKELTIENRGSVQSDRLIITQDLKNLLSIHEEIYSKDNKLLLLKFRKFCKENKIT
jgi:hypothetical protein